MRATTCLAAAMLCATASGQVFFFSESVTAEPSRTAVRGPAAAVVHASADLDVSGITDARDGTATINMTGDMVVNSGRVTVEAAGPDSEYVHTERQVGTVRFATGDLPTRLADFSLTFDGKFVTQGGDEFSAALRSLSVSARLFEFDVLNQRRYDTGVYVGPTVGNSNPVPTPLVENVAARDVREFDNIAFGAIRPTYILASEVVYEWEIVVELRTRVIQFDESTTPTIGVAVEYGGELSTFDGVTLSFSYEAVPTPGVASLLGLAGVAAARRRR